MARASGTQQLLLQYSGYVIVLQTTMSVCTHPVLLHADGLLTLQGGSDSCNTACIVTAQSVVVLRTVVNISVKPIHLHAEALLNWRNGKSNITKHIVLQRRGHEVVLQTVVDKC